MAYFARQIETCPHRRIDQHQTDGVDVVERHDRSVKCQVLAEVATETGRVNASSVNVTEAICKQCCRWPEPTVKIFNPVVASMVLDRLVDGQCNSQKAMVARAVAAIPITDSPPDDSIPQEENPDDVADPSVIASALPLPNPLGMPGVAPSMNVPTKRWMIGVTTAPRIRSTLDHCLHSIERAGFDHAHVFVDGGPSNDDHDDSSGAGASLDQARQVGFGVTRIHRQTNVGGLSNFVLSAMELVHRDPDAEGYLLLQDDALLARFSGVRPYLEQMLQQMGPTAIASLYSCAADQGCQAGWHQAREAMFRGAQGFLFTRQAIWQFLDHPMTRPWQIPWHHGSRRPLEQRGIDGNVGRWAFESGIPMWIPSPSLIWHLGETSTLWPGAVMLGIRRAGQFLEGPVLKKMPKT